MFWNLFKKKDNDIKEIVQLEMAEIMAKVDMDFKFLQSMQKLEVKDGDTIVFRYPRSLSEKAAENLTGSLRSVLDRFGYKNVNFMILEEGMDIGVLRNPRNDHGMKRKEG